MQIKKYYKCFTREFYMPLKLEVYDEQAKRWIQAGLVEPGSQRGSISNHLPEGREVYLCHER